MPEHARMTRRIGAALCVALGVLAAAGPALAQGRVVVDPRRVTLERLARPLTVEFEDIRLEEVVQFLETVTQVEIEPAWDDDRAGDGLDKDSPVGVRAREVPALTLIERILDRLPEDFSGGHTWQLSEDGILEIGPRARLNRASFTKIYDIQDLLFQIPDYTSVPELDLETALNQSQQGGGGGGGQSIFEDDDNDDREVQDPEEQAQEIIDLIVEFVEPEQWADNGGDGGDIRYWRGSLIIRAPDYIHRQVGGYDFWPRRLATRPDQRRADAERTERRLAARDEARRREQARSSEDAGSGR